MYDTYSPLEPQDWNQPTGFLQVPALDSTSDCCSTDSQESGFGSYSSPSVTSPSGFSVSTMDYSTLSHLTDDVAFSPDTVMSSQDTQPLDPAVWRYSVQGSVDAGFSPTQSYACQSSAMNLPVSQQEPSMYQLPGPYILWESRAPGSTMGTSPDLCPHTTPELGYQYSQNHFGLPMGCRATSDVETFPGTFPAYYLPGGQVSYSENYVPAVLAPPKRPLLPRTEAVDMASQPAYGSQRVLRPQIQGAYRPSASSPVSSIAGLPQETSADTVPSVTANSLASHALTSGIAPAVACDPDPAEGAFTDWIDFHNEGQASPEYTTYGPHKYHSAHVSSVMHGFPMLAAEQTRSPSTTEHSVQKVDLDLPKSIEPVQERAPKAMSNTSGSLTGESDEGRHRTHPLYSRPPDQDGMYRCPFKSEEPSCPHKQTKLKCNYDKYIDSHLKPFRCKVEACSKQEFSSTACLLRHEREAHGMHGHGDRPHLCYYEGCDRGVPGHGFPRRYNLFDHMKRVHDHKEDAVDATGSPILGGETQKKIKGAKRKASSSPVGGRPAQKAMSIHQLSVMDVPALQGPYQYPGYYYH